MGMIGHVEYIEGNQRYEWKADTFFEYGLKGVIANDLGWDYDQIARIEKIRDFSDDSVKIKTYLVMVNVNRKEYLKPYLVKVHCHDGEFSVYYVQL